MFKWLIGRPAPTTTLPIPIPTIPPVPSKSTNPPLPPVILNPIPTPVSPPIPNYDYVKVECRALNHIADNSEIRCAERSDCEWIQAQYSQDGTLMEPAFCRRKKCGTYRFLRNGECIDARNH